MAKFGLHIQLPSIEAPTPKTSTRTTLVTKETNLDSPKAVAQPPDIRSTASTSRLQEVKTSKYNIDINTLQRNIDRLAMADHAKSEVLHPKDLYRKAHPGLVSNGIDYTDPRQWYNSNATKKMIKKFTSNYQPSRTVAPQTEREVGTTGQVAFFVTFPNIRQTGEKTSTDFGIGRQRPSKKSAGSEGSVKHFPDIKTKASCDLKLEHSKTNIQIKNFKPNIDKSARSYYDKSDRELYTSSESLDNAGKVYNSRLATNTKIRSKSNTPDTEKRTTPIPRIELVIPSGNATLANHHTIPTPQRQNASQTSSAVNREMTESVEDILKSLTSIRGDETLRTLQQPPSTSIELPVIESNYVKGEMSPKESPKEYSNRSQPKQTAMKKAVSYNNIIKTVADPEYDYDEAAAAAMKKAESMDTLLTPPDGSRDKLMQLRLPKQRSEIDEINYFRDTYSLRQRSNLNLKTSTNPSGPDRRRSSTVLITDRSSDHTEVQSKIGPYIHGKIPDHYLVITDSNGEPQVVGLPPRTPETLPLPKSGVSHRTEKTLATVSDATATKDGVSSEAHTTLGTASALSHTPKSGAHSLANEITHPQRSTRSPRAKRTSIIPDDTQSTPANPPPSQLSSIKAYNPSKPRKSKTGKNLAVSDTCLYNMEKEKSVVNLSMKEWDSKPLRRKTLVRSIDKYIQEKLGDRLKDRDDLAVQIVVKDDKHYSTLDRVTERNTPESPGQPSHPLLRQTTRIKVPKSYKDDHEGQQRKGKRGVYRVKKIVTPFPERDRPTTIGRNEPMVYETYLVDKKKYKPQLRPPTFRLDMRQYPPNRPSISRDISFDKRKSSIIEHSMERKLTECDLKFPSRIASGIPTNAETPTDLLKPPEDNTAQPRNKRTPGNGGGSYIEFHIVSKSREGEQGQSLHNAGGFNLDSYVKSMQAQEDDADTPVDSIDASMMREIYDNLDSYLGRMNSRGHDGRERSYEDMMME